MSDHGFHVHGPHDHELEHATHGGGHGHDEASAGMTNQIAMFTAIIATVGAIFGYMGGAGAASQWVAVSTGAAIRYSPDMGVTWLNREGNISTYGPTHLNICVPILTVPA